MLQIPIDEMRYHANILTKEERLFGERTYLRVIAKHKELPDFIKKSLAPLFLSSEQEKALLTDIVLAFSHYAHFSLSPATEDELDARTEKWLHAFLPYIAQNLSFFRASHLLQYEPIALASIYISNTILNRIPNLTIPTDTNDLLFWFLHDWCSLFRALRSIMLLLSMGDDAHAMALFRGTLELFAKLKLALQFPEEYPLFKKFNLYLQDKKHNGTPIPKEMADYLEGEKDFTRSKESFLSYGWARKASGERILTMKDFVFEALGKNEDVALLFQTASEFVHEDYSGLGYDFIAIRRHLTDFCFWLCASLMKDKELLPFLADKERRRLSHLVSLTAPFYRGEVPLEK